MARYSPEEIPKNIEELQTWLFSELQRIAVALGEVENVVLPTLNVASDKPRDGLIVLADGVNWNPGSGAGFYGYRGGAWHFLE